MDVLQIRPSNTTSTEILKLAKMNLRPMKKVLVFSSQFGKPFYGGAEMSIFEYYKSVDNLDAEFRICTLDGDFNQDMFYPELPNVQIARYRTRLPHPVLERTKVSTIRKVFMHTLSLSIGMNPVAIFKEFQKTKPDVVVTHNLAGWGYLPWVISRLLRIPVIHDNRDFYLDCIQTTRWKSEQGTCKQTCLKCIPREVATKLAWGGGIQICNSLFLENEIRRIFKGKGKTSFEVIYPPTKILSVNKRRVIEQYDLVFVGRLEEAKGIRQFLEASKSQGYLIGVGGDGDLREELMMKFPAVDFLGVVDGQELMSKAKVLVVPSLWPETYGRVVLEGVAMGIPVLVSNRGALTEFKSRTGSTVIEVNPEDLQQFAMKIKQALSISKNQLDPEAKWIEEHFDEQLAKFRRILTTALHMRSSD